MFSKYKLLFPIISIVIYCYFINRALDRDGSAKKERESVRGTIGEIRFIFYSPKLAIVVSIAGILLSILIIYLECFVWR